MHGLMMDFQLTIPAIARRAEQLYAGRSVVSRLPDKRIHRTTFGETLQRARRLSGALRELGVRPDDRVATLCWNHHQHLEAYFGIPSMGAVLHTLNIRLHADELAYIAAHAADKVVIVDRSLLPLVERFRDRTAIEHVIVVGGGADTPPGMHDYETLINAAAELPFSETLDERQAAALCYTSGTTGRPKGVLYTHRSTVMHSLGCAMWDQELVRERDVIMPIVPMFHANAWGYPYTCMLVGAGLAFPGPHLDPESVLSLIAGERVSVGAGVPTVWHAVLQALDAQPHTYDLSTVRVLMSGGASVPEVMIRAFKERHGIDMVQGWGMTETSPVATLARLAAALEAADMDTKYRVAAKAGRPLVFIETRVRSADGIAPWDDETMGELEVRGPWVSSAYYDSPESADRFTDDGWFRTGDIATIDARGYVTIRDREKDVIKSGGEWISSVALENALMKHPAVSEAAVVGLRHPTWDERPLALVVRRPGMDCTPDELAALLACDFQKFWIPNAFEFIEAIPRTSVGKVHKLALRNQYREYFMPLNS
ncbi:MAG: fatty-acid--CoA ligase [Gemmatimonadetes bacterium]|nr:fatty-acid--CoA ligase [Gemmatimonadota bacterium]